MPRTPRSELVDGICHVTARGNRRARIFPTPLHSFEFLTSLAAAAARNEVLCHAYCLMPNHVHLILDAPQPQLSRSMQELLGGYAQRFNVRHELSGHLWQGRFGSEPVQDDAHLLEVVRYVVLNPVRAGICSHPSEWPWSSYDAMIGEIAAPPFLTTHLVLGAIDPRPAEARSLLEGFVLDGLSRYPNPYVPGKRSARIRTSSAAGSPTTFR